MSSAGSLVSDLAGRGAQLGSERAALAWDGGSRSYGELAQRVGRLAALLQRRGGGEGTRIALLSPNCPELIEMVLAAGMLGATVVPINSRLAPAEVEFELDHSKATHGLVHPALHDLASQSHLLDREVLFVGPELEADLSRVDAVPSPQARPGDETILLQIYTSGTTGRPKGCMLSHRNLLATSTNAVWAARLRPTDAYVVWPPMIHRGGLDLALAILLAGGTVIIGDSPDADAIWDLAEMHQATGLSTMPRDLAVFHHEAARRRGRTIERIIHGAAFDGPGFFDLLDDVMPNVHYCGSYGLSEAGVLVTAAIGDAERLHPGTIGRPSLLCQVSILDEEDVPVPAHTVGELCVRGPSTMVGYFEQSVETAETLRNGWLHTGDLANMDGDGFVYFAGRSKDMVKSGGENVYCTEVEAVLQRHPDVAEAIVFGVPDDRWGEAVKAVIVAVAGREPTPEALDTHCLAELSAFKRPRWYEFLPDERVPRSTFRKPSKAELRAAHDGSDAVRLPERPR